MRKRKSHIGRDADTGRFVTKEFADGHRTTTFTAPIPNRGECERGDAVSPSRVRLGERVLRRAGRYGVAC